MATRCCSPPEIWLRYLSLMGRIAHFPHQAQGLVDRRSRRPAFADPVRDEDVLQGGELGQEIVELEDEPDVGVPVGRIGVDVAGREIPAVDDDFARGGALEQADDIEQGRLARARGADDRGERSPLETDVDAVEDLGRHHVAEALDQVPGGDDVSHSG